MLYKILYIILYKKYCCNCWGMVQFVDLFLNKLHVRITHLFSDYKYNPKSWYTGTAANNTFLTKMLTTLRFRLQTLNSIDRKRDRQRDRQAGRQPGRQYNL